MPRNQTRVVIAYDFDGTLAPGNMQERNFIPALGLTPKRFWEQVKHHAKMHDMDEILAYMELMLREADAKGHPVDKTAFEAFGRKLTFFPGVEEWFDRINLYAKERGLRLEHYVISSGLREMIGSTSIAKHFRYVFASGFRYDQHNVAKWPALAVNYTTKTQYLFRINKGIVNSWDNSRINKFSPPEERPVPFPNMIYLGDGETDIPAMKMVTYQGGRAIAVYPPKRKGVREAAERLVLLERASGAVSADYRPGKRLEKVVCALLDEIVARSRFYSLGMPPADKSATNEPAPQPEGEQRIEVPQFAPAMQENGHAKA